jgi:Mn2+/Fe2+ NRAMP family transporter
MNFKKIFEIALGVVTSVGGFLEVGSIATAAQAGATFRFQLLWPIALGTICLIFLIEMSGRLAAVCHHPLPSAVRERFGFNFYVVPLCAVTIVDFLVLASEIGGACVGVQLMTGIAFRWWALPIALLAWTLLWYGNFSVIEYGVSMLGLITVSFVVAALKMHPDPAAMARGLMPTLPHHDRTNYWFLVVSILGATISPYLFNFYSSGAVEDKWTEDDLTPNRITATLGMSFGGFMSFGVLVAAAMVLHPLGIRVEQYEQVPMIVSHPLGMWGFWLFGAGLTIACFGAALEVSLDIAYVWAQTFGWNWGENTKPADASRFSVVYTIFIFVGSIPILLGVDPLKLTVFSMALTAVILPFVVVPFLVLMNDEKHVGKHRNGLISNIVVGFVIVLAFIVAIVAIPLEIFGGS